MEELTGGASLEANIALVRNNASVAASIAHAYAELNTENGTASETAPDADAALVLRAAF